MRFAMCLFKYGPYGGLEKNFLRIAREAAARGHDVTVYTRAWQGDEPRDIAISVIETHALTNHGNAARFAKRLQQEIATRDHDLVVGFNRMPGLNLYYNADVCFAKQARENHGALYRWSPRFRLYSRFEKAVFGPDSRTHIMYLSRAVKEDYQRHYHTQEERFHELPPGIDKDHIRAAAGLRERMRGRMGLTDTHRMLLMVGSDFRRKGVGRSIRALAALPSEIRDISHLFVIGHGKPKSLIDLARKLDIGDQVEFLGGRDDVPAYLAAADLLLHPAVTENTGNAILEALVAGLPVITTSNCGFAFHVAEADAGLVVPGRPFDQEALNQALERAFSDDPLVRWQRNALTYADRVDLYSRPATAVALMESLAAERARLGSGNGLSSPGRVASEHPH